MWEDPIVAEVRRVRAAHAARFNNDLRAIYDDLKRDEQQHRERLVSFPPAVWPAIRQRSAGRPIRRPSREEPADRAIMASQETPVPNVLEPADRAALAERLRAVIPDSPRVWGRMSPAQMLCHLSDSVEVMFGDRPYSPVPRALRLMGRLFKPLILKKGFPRGKAQAPTTMLVRQPESWDADLARALAQLERFAQPLTQWPESPFLGTLTTDEVGRLNWLHFDHHLQQFGV